MALVLKTSGRKSHRFESCTLRTPYFLTFIKIPQGILRDEGGYAERLRQWFAKP
jgi:hypothetical protein